MTTWGDGIDWNNEARRAAAHDAVGAPASCQMLEEIKAAMEPVNRRPRVVDCGCNIGQFFPMFDAAGFEYVGIDQAHESLEIARKRWPEALFLKAFLWDDWQGALSRILADVAICNAVLQHNSHAEKERILPRIADAVRPGGLFAMQESTVQEATATQLRPEQWIALVRRHGFRLLKTWHKNELGLNDGYLFRRV
jgi:2-polyprenyl-3-methyl-5-hydroxy-6-metoxy-1,4-benzoquinol methylase